MSLTPLPASEPRLFTLRAMADGVREVAEFRGRRLALQSSNDPPAAAVVVPATLTVAIFLSEDRKYYATYDEIPQRGTPEWDRYQHEGTALYIRMADTLEDLRARLYGVRPHEGALIDRAIGSAQRTLEGK